MKLKFSIDKYIICGIIYFVGIFLGGIKYGNHSIS